MNLQPLVGLVARAVLLAEGVGPWQVAGGLLVLGGRRPHRPESDSEWPRR